MHRSLSTTRRDTTVLEHPVSTMATWGRSLIRTLTVGSCVFPEGKAPTQHSGLPLSRFPGSGSSGRHGPVLRISNT